MQSIKHDKKKYEIPTSLDELTYEQFMRVKDWDGIHHAELIERLLEIDYDIALEIADTKLKAKDLFSLYNINFKDKTDKAPKTIVIRGVKCKVPKNLFNESTFGQKAVLEKIIKSVKPDDWDIEIYGKLTQIMAVYFYPMIVKGKFNSEKYTDVIRIIDKCNFLNVLSIGFFLLASWIASMNLSGSDSVLQTLKNGRQALNALSGLEQ